MGEGGGKACKLGTKKNLNHNVRVKNDLGSLMSVHIHPFDSIIG